MLRCIRRALGALVFALGAVALGGPVPDDAIVQYFRAPDHDLIKDFMPDCDFWRKEDLAKKVPDKCCDVKAWPVESKFSSTPPDPRTNPFNKQDKKKYACYVRERLPAPGTYIRNAFACERGQLKLSEGCRPTGTSMGKGYPMNASTAEQNQELNGDSRTCNCDPPGYAGAGCFVALSSFIAGVGPDPTANFVKLAGSACPPEAEL
eukprot:gb/GFBE01015022.1/.p1 GENE.gb/GFBE01015022.1/~~gb/GFBE01015022.1/.p1  ORF type:complete len:206 (+),score=37.34 gb/GFBE01015022.1/:1-618(+)